MTDQANAATKLRLTTCFAGNSAEAYSPTAPRDGASLTASKAKGRAG